MKQAFKMKVMDRNKIKDTFTLKKHVLSDLKDELLSSITKKKEQVNLWES